MKLLLFLALLLFSHPHFAPQEYQGQHRKLDGQIKLRVGLGELNRAYGYLKIGEQVDSIVRGGTVINKDLQRDSSQLELHLQSGAWLKVRDFGEEALKLRYYNIARLGTKALKLRLRRVDIASEENDS